MHAESLAKRFFGSGSVRCIDTGRWFELSGHPVQDKDPADALNWPTIGLSIMATQAIPQAIRFALPAICLARARM